jgi:hypothetical protein
MADGTSYSGKAVCHTVIIVTRPAAGTGAAPTELKITNRKMRFHVTE